MAMHFRLVLSAVVERFMVRLHGGVEIPAVSNASFSVAPGECAGQIVEDGLTDRVLDDPEYPYTQILISSMLQV